MLQSFSVQSQYNRKSFVLMKPTYGRLWHHETRLSSSPRSSCAKGHYNSRNLSEHIQVISIWVKYFWLSCWFPGHRHVREPTMPFIQINVASILDAISTVTVKTRLDCRLTHDWEAVFERHRWYTEVGIFGGNK